MIGWLGCYKKQTLEVYVNFVVYTRPFMFTIASKAVVCSHCFACDVSTRSVCIEVTQLGNGREVLTMS